MKIGDMRCPWHPDMTLFECQPLHEAVTACSQHPAMMLTECKHLHSEGPEE